MGQAVRERVDRPMQPWVAAKGGAARPVDMRWSASAGMD